MKLSTLIVGRAADFEGNGFAVEVEVDVAEPPAVPVAVAAVLCPSIVAKLGSAENCADTPEELVQLDVPIPEMKFTCIH
jgi:hypothetical protein